MWRLDIISTPKSFVAGCSLDSNRPSLHCYHPYFIFLRNSALKIESTPLEDQQVKLKVEIEPDQLESAKHRAARNIAKRTKIPGFRPGKAPYNIVERFAGQSAILEEAIELLVNEVYPKAIDEAGLKPYGPGKLENIPTTEPPTFEFVVPLEAEVNLGDYKTIRIPYELKPISDAEVERVLQNMREQQAVLEPVDRPAQEGDQVSVKVSAERKNAKEGETPTLIRERSVSIVIRPEKQEDQEAAGQEWPYPGFSRQLIGLKAGDEKTVEYTFSEDSPFELFRGTQAEYHVIVENVKSRTLPELNDELAQSQGEYENLEALRTEIRKQLEQRAQNEYNEEYDDKIFEALSTDAQVKYPPQMLDQEVDSMIHSLENRLGQQNMDMETYLKMRQITKEDLSKETRPLAETRLTRFLMLSEISKRENVQIAPEAIQNETINTMNMLFGNMPPKEQRKALTQDMIMSLTSTVTADMMIQETLNRLRSIAKGEADQSPVEEAAELPAAEAVLSAEEAQIIESQTATEGETVAQVENLDETVHDELTQSEESPVENQAAEENQANTQKPARRKSSKRKKTEQD